MSKTLKVKIMTTTTNRPTLNNKIVCLYPNNCTDGMMSAVIAKFYHHKDDFVAVPVQYQKPTEEDKSPILGDNVDVVYILDFSFSPEKTLPMLFKSDGTRRKVVMLDHHLSAMNEWFSRTKENHLFGKLYEQSPVGSTGEHSVTENKSYFLNKPGSCKGNEFSCYIDMTKSGALLTLEYFTNRHTESSVAEIMSDVEVENITVSIFGQCWDMLKIISTYVSDRDLWKFEYKETLACYELLNSWKQDVDVWLDNIYYYSMKSPIGCFSDDINMMQSRIDMRDELATEYASKAQKVTILNKTGMIVNVPSNFTSIVASKLYDKEGIDFAMCYVVGGSDYVIFSMRSSQKKDFDCEAIAKVMGGGGHKNAAGFRGDIALLTDFLNAIVKT